MRKIHPTTYCLYCYAPLDLAEDSSRHCPRCGQLDIRVDHSIYWTREPWLARVEAGLKIAVVAVILGVGAVVIPEFMELAASGPGAGFVIIVPLVALTMLLWQTVSRITRKPRYTRVRLTWTLLLALIPIAPLLMGGAISFSTANMEVGEFFVGENFTRWALLPCGLCCVLVWVVASWFEGWRLRRIAVGLAVGR